MRMLAPTSNLDNAGVLCILAVLAAVFAVSLGGALAHTMRALLVLSHVNYPLFRIALMVGLENQMVKRIAGKYGRRSHASEQLALAFTIENRESYPLLFRTVSGWTQH